MHFCLNGRQREDYLAVADEIFIEARDVQAIPDYHDKYPNAILILEYDIFSMTDDELTTLSILSQNKMVVMSEDFEHLTQAKRCGIPFFYARPIRTFDEHKALKDFGVEYVRVDAPLFFRMRDLPTHPKIRVTPSAAHLDNIPRENGVVGSWIRPEDLYLYEDIVYVCEFNDGRFSSDAVKAHQRERALFRVYTKKEWPGELGEIVYGLNALCTNRLVPPGVGEARLSCGQRCLEGRNCKICWRAFEVANEEKLTEYKNEVLSS